MIKFRRIHLLIASCFALLLSVSAHASAAPAQTTTGPYINASDYLQGDAYYAWYDMTWKLKRNFDDICGDTFCEGEYSNIESLRYRCSVNQVSGRIGMCAWVFAASNEGIDSTTGEISTQTKFWQCRTPLASHTRIEELLIALAGDSLLHAPLPGSNRTIMDGLIDCLF